MDGDFQIKGDVLSVPAWEWDTRHSTIFRHPVRAEAFARSDDGHGVIAPGAYLTFANGWVLTLGFIVYETPAPHEYRAGVVALSSYWGDGRIVRDPRTYQSLGLVDAPFQLVPRIEEIASLGKWDMARGVIVDGARREKTPEQLIATHVEPHPLNPGIAEYRLRDEDNGYPVWAIIGDLDPDGANAAQVARDYAISREAVEAARAFYARNKEAIDARLAANRAA